MSERKIGISPEREALTLLIIAFFSIVVGIISLVFAYYAWSNMGSGKVGADVTIICAPTGVFALIVGIWSAIEGIRKYREYSKQNKHRSKNSS